MVGFANWTMQTEEARAEAIHLMGSIANLATPKNGEIMISATQVSQQGCCNTELSLQEKRNAKRDVFNFQSKGQALGDLMVAGSPFPQLMPVNCGRGMHGRYTQDGRDAINFFQVFVKLCLYASGVSHSDGYTDNHSLPPPRTS